MPMISISLETLSKLNLFIVKKKGITQNETQAYIEKSPRSYKPSYLKPATPAKIIPLSFWNIPTAITPQEPAPK